MTLEEFRLRGFVDRGRQQRHDKGRLVASQGIQESDDVGDLLRGTAPAQLRFAQRRHRLLQRGILAIVEVWNAVAAYRRIAEAGAKFVSRGDNSGTHQKEMSVWNAAKIKPEGTWYIVTRDFMTASLKRAEAEGAYFMTDSSTWVAEKANVPRLKILFRGDKALVNTYHALAAPEGATPGRATAIKFIESVASPDGQRIVRDFGKDRFGEGLYNDAAYVRKYAD